MNYDAFLDVPDTRNPHELGEKKPRTSHLASGIWMLSPAPHHQQKTRTQKETTLEGANNRLAGACVSFPPSLKRTLKRSFFAVSPPLRIVFILCS